MTRMDDERCAHGERDPRAEAVKVMQPSPLGQAVASLLQKETP